MQRAWGAAPAACLVLKKQAAGFDQATIPSQRGCGFTQGCLLSPITSHSVKYLDFRSPCHFLPVYLSKLRWVLREPRAGASTWENLSL